MAAGYMLAACRAPACTRSHDGMRGATPTVALMAAAMHMAVALAAAVAARTAAAAAPEAAMVGSSSGGGGTGDAEAANNT